jgi:hypothetical protein
MVKAPAVIAENTSYKSVSHPIYGMITSCYNLYFEPQQYINHGIFHDIATLFMVKAPFSTMVTVMVQNTNYKSASHPIYGINHIYNHINHHLYLVFGALTVDIRG